MMLRLKLQYFGHLMQRVDSLEKTLMLGGIGGTRKRGQQDEMAGWHHRLDGREFEWTPGVGDGQGGLACCNSWGRKESDMTERLNWTEPNWKFYRWEFWCVSHWDKNQGLARLFSFLEALGVNLFSGLQLVENTRFLIKPSSTTFKASNLGFGKDFLAITEKHKLYF